MSEPSRPAGQDARNLGLNVGDHAGDDVGKLLQHMPGRMALQHINVAELYKAGKLQVHLHLGTFDEKPDGELLFRAIPPIRPNLNEPTAELELLEEKIDCGLQCDGVFAGVGHLIQGHKDVVASGVGVPSRVWLKAPEKPMKLRGYLPFG